MLNICCLIAVELLFFLNFCQGTFCEYPPNPLAGQVDLLHTNNGSIFAHYACIDGYYLIGNEFVECLPSTGWNSIPICAVDVSLHKPASYSGGLTSPQLPLQQNYSSKHEGKYCTPTTNNGKVTWWTVDLLVATNVEVVNLTLAEDEPLPTSIEVRIGNSSLYQENVLCNWLSSGWLKKGGKFKLVECQYTGRYVTLTSVGSNSGFTLCNVKVLAGGKSEQSVQVCMGEPVSGGRLIVLDGVCYMKTDNLRLSFNQSLAYCADQGLSLLTNQPSEGYQVMINWENVGRLGRKVIWIGAKLIHRKWYWIDSIEQGLIKSSSVIVNQPWGLHEPSGEDCVVADSALKWHWNSIRCVISANFVCQGSPQRCPHPEVQAGSHIVQDYRPYHQVGTMLNYKCPSGHMPTHPEVRTCLQDGHWSGQPPDCQYIDCQDYHGLEEEVVVEYLDGRTTYGARLRLSCAPGYIKVGQHMDQIVNQETYICKQTGWQNQSRFECVWKHCGWPIFRTDVFDSFIIDVTSNGSMNMSYQCKSNTITLNISCPQDTEEQVTNFCVNLNNVQSRITTAATAAATTPMTTLRSPFKILKSDGISLTTAPFHCYMCQLGLILNVIIAVNMNSV